MTTAPTPINPFYDVLVERVGEGTALAILNLINNRIDVRTPEIISDIFGADREVLAGLAQRVRELHQRYGDQPAVRAVAAEVARATRGHNATDATSEREVDADAARTQRAAEAVDEAERELARADSAGSQPEEPAVRAPEASVDAERCRRHEAILAVDHDGERPPSRLDTMQDEIDSLCLRVDEHQGVIASAFAQARASVNGANALVRVGVIGLVAFGVTFLICCLVVMLSPLEWDWLNIIGLSAVAAGIAALIAFLRADFGVETLSYAEAATIVAAERRRDESARGSDSPEGLTIMNEEEARTAAEVAADRPRRSASASARASVR